MTDDYFFDAMRERSLSAAFTAADLCCAGETWRRIRIVNEPCQQESWAALAALCELILEPVLARFGRPDITYGFTSPQLIREIPAHSAPRLDQHASYEINSRGKRICERGGAAVDIAIADVPSDRLAIWIAENLPFDRIYFYGADRPLHVSHGPDTTGQIVRMTPQLSGRRVPSVIPLKRLKA